MNHWKKEKSWKKVASYYHITLRSFMMFPEKEVWYNIQRHLVTVEQQL